MSLNGCRLQAAEERRRRSARRARSANATRRPAADIAGDPLVLALQETFDATIVPDSIRRIEYVDIEGS